MIRAVLIDLSGTLHIDSTAIPGAIEALQRLRKTNLKIKFVTNTTKENQNFLYQRLCQLGFAISKEEIFSSLSAARKLVIKENLKPMLLLTPSAKEDFEGLEAKDCEIPNAVVVGLAPEEFNYERLNQAFRLLLNGAKLIAIHEAKYYKRSDGLALGPGCFTRGLEYSAQCRAKVVGKPNPNFFLSAIEDVKPNEAVMIGDDVQDDILGALNVGMQGYLVKTGKYRLDDEHKIVPEPTAVCASFVEAVDKIISNLKDNSC